MSQQFSHDLDTLFAQFRRERDPELLAQIFKSTSTPLYQRARSLVGDGMLAEDLVQETFLTLLEAASGYDSSRPVLPYIHGILHRKAMRALEQLRKKPQPVADTTVPEPVAPDRSAPERLGCAELARRVLQALRGLPSRYREVLQLFLEQSKTPKEIGAILDREPGTVRAQVHRGLQMLRGSLPRSLAGALVASLCMADLRAASRLPVPVVQATPAAKSLLVAALVLLVGAGITGWWLWDVGVGLDSAVRDPGNRGSTRAASGDTTTPAVTPSPGHATDASSRRPVRRLALQLQLEATGQPVPHVGALVLVAPGREVDFQDARFVSGLDGRIVLPELAAGRYQVVLDRGVAQEFTVPPQGSMDHVIEVPRGVTVRGRVVTATGAPIPGAKIWLQPLRPRYPDGQAVCSCDDEGRFELLGVKPLTRLGAVAPDGRPSPLKLVNYRKEQELELVTVADIGSLRGRVLSRDGAPVAHAVVLVGRQPRQAYDYNCGFEFDAGYPTRRVHTGRDGSFVLAGLVPGTVQVLVRAPAKVTGLVSVEIQAGQTKQIRCQLRDGLRIQGRVVDLNLQPVPGAWVHAQGRGQHEWAAAQSGADGGFLLDSLNPDRVLLSVEAEGYRRAAPSLLPEHRAGALLEVVLAKNMQTRGRVLAADGGPPSADGFEVAVVTKPVRPEAPPPAHAVNADGRFTIPEIPADARYFVRCSSQKIWLAAKARRQVVQDEVHVDLLLPANFFEQATLSGQLAGLELAALQDAVLIAERDGWRYPQTVRLDPDSGRFQVGPLAVGSYRLRMVARTGRFPPMDLGSRSLGSGQLNDLGVVLVKAGQLRYSFALTNGAKIRQLIAWVVDARGMVIPLKGARGTVALQPGEYRLRAGSQSFMTIRDRSFTVHQGEETLLDLRLPPARRLQIRFCLPPDIDMAHTTGRLRNQEGNIIELQGFETSTDRECGFTRVLAPGSYVLDLHAGEHRLQGRFRVSGTADTGPLVVQLHRQ